MTAAATGAAMGKVANFELSELAAGRSAAVEHRFSAEDIDTFAQLSGDVSPLHMDASYARRCGFRDRVVHGALLAALASRLVGTELPGRRALLLGLRLDFAAPTYPGDLIRLEAEVKSVHVEQRAVQLQLSATCGGVLRARGSALVQLRADEADDVEV